MFYLCFIEVLTNFSEIVYSTSVIWEYSGGCPQISALGQKRKKNVFLVSTQNLIFTNDPNIFIDAKRLYPKLWKFPDRKHAAYQTLYETDNVCLHLHVAAFFSI
jgi:hypothetical protein